jgi:hypothetical protein
MTTPDTTIADLHQIRRQIADEFGNDLLAINASARARMERSGRPLWRPKPAVTPIPDPLSSQSTPTGVAAEPSAEA